MRLEIFLPVAFNHLMLSLLLLRFFARKYLFVQQERATTFFEQHKKLNSAA
jgi:hypothetical protein